MPHVEKMSIALTPELAAAVRAAVANGNMSVAARSSARRCGTGSYVVPYIRKNWRNCGTCGTRVDSGAGTLADMAAIKAEARRRLAQAE